MKLKAIFFLLCIALWGCNDDENSDSSFDIQLNKSTLTLEQGSSERLVALFTPENTPSQAHDWYSSDPNIASVDETGMVTAVSTGSAIITARAVANGKEANCLVTIVESGSMVHITGISLNRNSASLAIGESLQLTATIQPSNATNQNVTWTSSDPAVASVDQQGNVIALYAGTTTITATTDDGGKTATCRINVNETSEDPVVTDIEISFTLTDIYSSQLIFVADAPEGATEVNVCYGTSPHPTITDEITVATLNEEGKLELQLVNLFKGTTYYIRCYRQNGNQFEYSETETSAQTISEDTDHTDALFCMEYDFVDYVYDYGDGEGVAAFFTINYDIQGEGQYQIEALHSLTTLRKGTNIHGAGNYNKSMYIDAGKDSFTLRIENALQIITGVISFGPAPELLCTNLETNIRYHFVLPPTIRINSTD